jgi:hypothetical protein
MGERKYPLSLIVRAVDKATGPLRRINQKMVKAMRPMSVGARRLGNTIKAFGRESGLTKLAGASHTLGKSIGKVGRETWALGKQFLALGAVAGVALYSIIRGAVNAGDDLQTLADRLELPVDTFAQLQFAAEQNDVSAEEFAKSMDELNKRMGEAKAGGGALASLLKKVAPSLLVQLKAAKGNEEAFRLLSDAMVSLEDPNKRAALSAAAFGKGGKVMAALLGQGNAKIDELRQKYALLAGSQTKFAGGAGDLDNAMRETETAFLGVRNAIMGELFPAFTAISRGITNGLIGQREGLREWAKTFGEELPGKVQSFAKSVMKLHDDLQPLWGMLLKVVDALGGVQGVMTIVAATMGAKLLLAVGDLALQLGVLAKALLLTTYRLAALAIGPVVAAIATFITAIKAGSGVMAAFNVVLTANPIGVIIMAIAALAAAAYLIYDNWEPIKAFFVDLWDGIVGAFTRAWEKIKPIVDLVIQGFKMLMNNPFETLKKGFGFWSDKVFGADSARPTLGADAARPPPGGGGSTHLKVEFDNVPKGARVTTDPKSTADIDMSMGYSLVSPL